MIKQLKQINWSKKKIFILLFFGSLLIYGIFCQKTANTHDYFVPLAKAFLAGKIDIEPNPNFNELVPWEGKYYVVYPPAPAVLLIPGLLLFGAGFQQVWLSVFFAAGAVALFFLVLLNFTTHKKYALLLATTLGFGSNFFFTALEGSAWYLAHICAVFFLVLGLYFSTGKQKFPFWAGFALCLAFLSRLPVIMAAPLFIYFLLLGEKKKVWALIKFIIPVLVGIAIYGWYNFARFDSIFQTGYSLIPGELELDIFKYGIFDWRYIPRQLYVIFLAISNITYHGKDGTMALWLTTPLLVYLVYWRLSTWREKIFLSTVILVALPSLMHGGVGYVQFGYRFSLDYLPLLLLMLLDIFTKHKFKWIEWLFWAGLIINFFATISAYLLFPFLLERG